MPSNEVSLTVDFKNVKLVQEIIKKFTDEATRLEERNGILYSHIELLNKALDVLCPLVARTIDFLPSEQFTLRAATREALDNVTYIQNKEYRENTNPDYYKEEMVEILNRRPIRESFEHALVGASLVAAARLQDKDFEIQDLKAENERLSQMLHDELSQLEIATDLGNKRWVALNEIYEDGEKHNANWCKRKAQEGLGIKNA